MAAGQPVCKRPRKCAYCGIGDHPVFSCALRDSRYPQVERYVEAQRVAYLSKREQEEAPAYLEQDPGPKAS
eukprot:11556465-Alexandrium_andersonii.AAC.1